MINVLLVSPRLPPDDNRYCGDNAYTDTLLQHPPPGVRYYHYEDLMATGQVRKIKWLYRIGPRLVRWGILPPDLWAEYLVSDFVPDILHIYGFSAVVRFPKSAKPVPVVLGAGTGSYSVLKYYLGWEDTHIRQSRQRTRTYLRLISAHDASLNPFHASRVLVWSDFSRQMHLDEGFTRPEQIEVLYPGLLCRDNPKQQTIEKKGITFLFIGQDFERKNGYVTFDAFCQIYKRYPNTNLVLVGNPMDKSTIAGPGVTHYHFVPRKELLQSFYPQADVLVLPSRAEGFGLVLLEAMSFGLPVVGINAWAMPEVVSDGENGFLVKAASVKALVDVMERFLSQPEILVRMRHAAQETIRQRFSIDEHNQKLGQVYGRILQ